MIRDKSEIKSLGLDDSDGTVRGRLLADVVSDDAQSWPKYRRFGIFDEGREWRVIARTATTLTVAGDQRDFVIVDDTLNLTRVIATSPFSSTPLTVSLRTMAFNSTSQQYETTFTFLEAVPALSLDRGDFLNIATIRPAHFQIFNIQSLVAGANGGAVITDPDNVLVSEDPIYKRDMFLVGDLVEISGSDVNDGLYECRADFTDNGSTITVHLDGFINTPAGALGQLTLHLPPPQRVVATGRAVLEWYRAALTKGCDVQCRVPTTRQRWFTIIGADIGRSDEVEPDIP